MRTPRKLYILVSRKSAARVSSAPLVAWASKSKAQKAAVSRNESTWVDENDWRVETFVKDD